MKHVSPTIGQFVWAGVILLIFVLALLCIPGRGDAATLDPFQRCAASVLRGAYPGTPQWILHWYKRGLEDKRTVQGRCKQTFFGPFESDAISGGPFCWIGSERIRLNEAHAASNPELPKGSIVWTPYGIRCVVDRGGRVSLRYCRNGETLNLDYWNKRDLGTLRNAPYVVLRRGWGER